MEPWPESVDRDSTSAGIDFSNGTCPGAAGRVVGIGNGGGTVNSNKYLLPDKVACKYAVTRRNLDHRGYMLNRTSFRLSEHSTTPPRPLRPLRVSPNPVPVPPADKCNNVVNNVHPSDNPFCRLAARATTPSLRKCFVTWPVRNDSCYLSSPSEDFVQIAGTDSESVGMRIMGWFE